MDNLDEQFAFRVISAIASDPIKITRSVDERGVLLAVSLSEKDMPQVIGRGGETAKAIRTLLKIVGARNDSRVNLKILEVGE